MVPFVRSTRRIVPAQPNISTHLLEGFPELRRVGLLARTHLLLVVDELQGAAGAEGHALGRALAGVAFEDAARGSIVARVAKGTGDRAHLAADADLLVPVNEVGADGAAMHGPGGADLDAGRVVALLAHHGHRHAFALPGVCLHARGGGAELTFVLERTGQLAVVAPGALVRMDHQDFGHGSSLDDYQSIRWCDGRCRVSSRPAATLAPRKWSRAHRNAGAGRHGAQE